MTKRIGGCFTPNSLSPLDKRVGLRLRDVQFGVARVIHCKDGRVKARAPGTGHWVLRPQDQVPGAGEKRLGDQLNVQREVSEEGCI